MLNNVVMLWSAYHCVHGTSRFFVYFVSQCIHLAIPTSARFLSKTFYKDLFLFFVDCYTYFVAAL